MLVQYTCFMAKVLDKAGYVGSNLMDLPKPYDCIPHDVKVTIKLSNK